MDAQDVWPSLRTIAAFVLVAIAASTIAEACRKSLRLPLITGYILGGIVCGPHVVGLLSATQCKQLAHIVTDDAMGFIGFSAGSKFLLSELQGSLKPVLCLLLGLVAVTYTLVFSGLYFLAPWLELTAGMRQAQVVAIGLIIACLAVARSPSSAIALVSELNAHGTFTTAALSVTVLMDVVVVLLFALTLLFVHAVDPEPGKPVTPAGVVLGIFGLQLVVSALVGVALAFVLNQLILLSSTGVATAAKLAVQKNEALASLSVTKQEDAKPSTVTVNVPHAPTPAEAPASKSAPSGPPGRSLRRWGSVIGASSHSGAASAAAAAIAAKATDAASNAPLVDKGGVKGRQAAAMAALWLVAKLSLMAAESLVMQVAGFEIFQSEELEEASFGVSYHQPLVISMVAGFVIVNFTSSRRSFLRILHDSSEPVYIAFFTLTGSTLALDALLPNLPTAALIFSLRLLGICVGSYWGGRLGGSSHEHYSRYWMAFITQAGVALGLASRVASEFSYGPMVALCVTAEVVVNQIVGPILFKAAIISVGEAHGAYAPGQAAPPLGTSPPARPAPRSALLISNASDAAALSLRQRLLRRQWTVAQVDAHLTIVNAAAPSEARARRATPSAAPGQEASGGALSRPLLGSICESGAYDGEGKREDSTSERMEASLQRAISSLPSLDVIVTMLPTDSENLAACRMLQSSAHLLNHLHQRQTSSPQLLVRVDDPSYEERVLSEPLPAFKVTPLVVGAAVPNLFAEVLHPECHWSLMLDNALDDDGQQPGGATDGV